MAWIYHSFDKLCLLLAMMKINGIYLNCIIKLLHASKELFYFLTFDGTFRQFTISPVDQTSEVIIFLFLRKEVLEADGLCCDGFSFLFFLARRTWT